MTIDSTRSRSARFGAPKRSSVSAISMGTTTTNETKPTSHSFDQKFRKLPPHEAFTKFAWFMIVCQTLISVCGAVLSYYAQNGAIGGVMSGIVGLWFVQMAWVMSLPSKCSIKPYYVGLCILPLSKAIGFLCVSGPDGEVVDWKEFLRRMAILCSMWCFPMYLAGNTTAEVLRCRHLDYSRYEERNSGGGPANHIFQTRREKGINADPHGVSIREMTMAATIKYIMILPIVVYITFNAIGALIEVSDYAEYGKPLDTMEDTFENKIGHQFYLDFYRIAYSNIFEGLVTVFTMITISGFSCSGMDLGEIMLFRFHRWEIVAIFANGLFFIAFVYFGSALFDPTDDAQDKAGYWSIFVLPCILMLALWRLTNTVILNKNDLTIKRLEENEDGGDEIPQMPHNFTDFIARASQRNLFGEEQGFSKVDKYSSTLTASISKRRRIEPEKTIRESFWEHDC